MEFHCFHIKERALESQQIEQERTANGLIFKCVLIAGQLTVGSTVTFSLLIILGLFRLG